MVIIIFFACWCPPQNKLITTQVRALQELAGGSNANITAGTPRQKAVQAAPSHTTPSLAVSYAIVTCPNNYAIATCLNNYPRYCYLP